MKLDWKNCVFFWNPKKKHISSLIYTIRFKNETISSSSSMLFSLNQNWHMIDKQDDEKKNILLKGKIPIHYYNKWQTNRWMNEWMDMINISSYSKIDMIFIIMMMMIRNIYH